METAIVLTAMAALSIAIVCAFIRAVRGPSVFDRVLALDLLALEFVGVALLLSIRFRSDLYIDLVLVVALLGFLGTMCLASYLEGSLVE